MGPNKQNQHFAALRQKMFIHAHSCALKRFAKFGMKTLMFCPKKVGKAVAKVTRFRLTIVKDNPRPKTYQNCFNMTGLVSVPEDRTRIINSDHKCDELSFSQSSKV